MKVDEPYEEKSNFDKAMKISVSLMEKDLEYTFPKFAIFEEENKRKVKLRVFYKRNWSKALRNILKAFIFYRLDLGYVRVGL